MLTRSLSNGKQATLFRFSEDSFSYSPNRIRDIRDGNSCEVPDNFEEEINRWTLDSVSVVALDKPLGLINANRSDPQAKKLFDNINQFFMLSAKIELKPNLPYLRSLLMKKAMTALDNIQVVTVGYVNEAIERLEREPFNKPEHEKSVLEKLLKIDKKIATVMAMDMLMAGVDTVRIFASLVHFREY